MSSRRLTFQTILPGCEQGDAKSWRAFLTNYTPIVTRLLATYASSVAEEGRARLWPEILSALAADSCARMRELDRQAEREFLIDLKGFVLDRLPQREDKTGGPGPTIELLQSVLQKLPLVHREIVLLRFMGYSESTLEKMLLVPASLIETAVAAIPADEAPILRGGEDAQSWRAARLGVLREVRATRTPECPPHRIFVRILDGQISWYEKTPAEESMARCIHCLDYWASLREIDYLRRDTVPLPVQEVEALLSNLPPGSIAAKSGSWVGRMFGR